VALPDDADAEAIQFEVYEVGKSHGFDNLRDWFRALYETLLGSEQGPRMGSFIALYGIAGTRRLIAKRSRRQRSTPLEGPRNRLRVGAFQRWSFSPFGLMGASRPSAAPSGVLPRRGHPGSDRGPFMRSIIIPLACILVVATPAAAATPREILTGAAFGTRDKAAALAQVGQAQAASAAILARAPHDREAGLILAMAIGYRAKLTRNRTDALAARKMFDALAAASPRDAEAQALVGGWHVDAVSQLGGLVAGAALGAKRATGLAALDRSVALGGGRALFPGLAALMRLSARRQRSPGRRARRSGGPRRHADAARPGHPAECCRRAGAAAGGECQGGAGARQGAAPLRPGRPLIRAGQGCSITQAARKRMLPGHARAVILSRRSGYTPRAPAGAGVDQHHVVAVADPAVEAADRRQAIAVRIGDHIAAAIEGGIEAVAGGDWAIAPAAVRADIAALAEDAIVRAAILAPVHAIVAPVPAIVTPVAPIVSPVAPIVTPVAAIFAPRLPQVLALVANVAAVAPALGVAQLAAFLADVLAIAPKLARLRAGDRRHERGGDQTHSQKLTHEIISFSASGSGGPWGPPIPTPAGVPDSN
jgi:hypothetical protein